MTRGKQAEKNGRVDLSLRVTAEQAERITRAAQIDGERRGLSGVRVSRNGFCVEIVLSAVEKILAEEELARRFLERKAKISDKNA